MKQTLLILMRLCCTLSVFHTAQAGEIGQTLKQLRSHFGHEESGSADVSSVVYTLNGLTTTFFFDPDGTVGQINLWKEAPDFHTQPFTAQEIRSLLNQASGVTWTLTANTLKLDADGFLQGELNFTGIQNGKLIFSANIGRDLRRYWILDVETIR